MFACFDRNKPTEQQSLAFLTPGIGFMEGSFPWTGGVGAVFQDDLSVLHLLCTLFLLLLHFDI